jgi:addiction module HigA family antidote
MAMKNPPHVGETIWHDIIKALDLSVTEGAKALGVTRQSLSLLINGRTSLTPDMALRIEKAFGPSMEHLMRMQLAYDLAQARQRSASIKVARYHRKPARDARPT